jgi:hypothetical protein
MSGETKQRLSDLEVENAELRQRLLDRPSLRDQFAMAALATIGAMTSDCMAETAYQIADEMMKARDAKD